MTLLGLLNPVSFIMLTMFVFVFTIMYSLFSILLEIYTFNKYQSATFVLTSFLFIFLETMIYQPLNMYFSLKGNYDYFLKKNKKGWGEMSRIGYMNNSLEEDLEYGRYYDGGIRYHAT